MELFPLEKCFFYLVAEEGCIRNEPNSDEPPSELQPGNIGCLIFQGGWCALCVCVCFVFQSQALLSGLPCGTLGGEAPLSLSSSLGLLSAPPLPQS